MDLVALVIGAVAGLGVGVAVAFVLRDRDRRALASMTAQMEFAERAKIEAQEREEMARADAGTQVETLRTDLAVIMADAARAVRTELIDQAKREREQDRTAVANIVTPVREHLERVGKDLDALNEQRIEQGTVLNERLDNAAGLMTALQGETSRLTTALRGNSTRGRWGEVQLRRVVEMAGLTEHISFSEHATTTDATGRIVPDLLIKLPEGRVVVVDSKAPMPAMDHDGSEEAHRQAAAKNAKDLGAHIKKLGQKDYAARVDGALDKVIMFLPAESVLAGALEADPGLLEAAYKNHVVIATPTTLLAVLTSIELVWKQKLLTESAALIAADGAKLYNSLVTFAEHLARSGTGLASAVKHYNGAVASLESRVLPAARSMKEHGVKAGQERAVPEPVTETLSVITAGELLVANEDADADTIAELELPDGVG